MTIKPSGLNIPVEDELLERFPPFCRPEDVKASTMPALTRPAVIEDVKGRILVWTLPGLLSNFRQVLLCVNDYLDPTDSSIETDSPLHRIHSITAPNCGPELRSISAVAHCGHILSTRGGLACRQLVGRSRHLCCRA